VELTRALTTVENARMEWNSARLKLPVLQGENQAPGAGEKSVAAAPLMHLSVGQLFKLGLALWPVALGILAIFLALILRK
jgi:hypothetical protein